MIWCDLWWVYSFITYCLQVTWVPARSINYSNETLLYYKQSREIVHSNWDVHRCLKVYCVLAFEQRTNHWWTNDDNHYTTATIMPTSDMSLCMFFHCLFLLVLAWTIQLQNGMTELLLMTSTDRFPKPFSFTF